jgi:2-succinyl-5-enolpyruvyl-6-hydroxy-3-cyclohexene-1-carboxylate synthase
MYSNYKLVLHLLSLMKQFGISKIVVSPGSRHFPIIHSMEADDYFTMYSVVDERSAAFFALGLIQQTGQPAAICCTSGTSASNYGSAVVEAFYQGLPLVVLTVDRLPELLGQKEEQVFRQHDLFDGFVKYSGQLKEAKDPLSEWYCNRIINEAFLELDHHGRGPVHLNIPIESHHLDTFETTNLPVARKITRVTADVDDEVWASYSDRLKGKRVLIIWGQSGPMPERLARALDLFVERFNCAIFTDKLSNCQHPRAIRSSYLVLRTMSANERDELAPEIVISLFGNYVFNGEMKAYLKYCGQSFEHWDIGRSDVCDPFRRLTTIFEMNEEFFFKKMSLATSATGGSAYFSGWRSIEDSITEPSTGFGEISAIGQLMRALPATAALQIANSLAIRITHFFESDPAIKSFCNRGVNGIDGCMSTAVGYAASSGEPVFLVIGDLTFFYDMNALWNRHLSPHLRILLLNNEGGGVMHLPLEASLAPVLSRHVSAGHVTSAKGWAESLGMHYLSATSQEEYDKALDVLVNSNEKRPILVEAFSKKEDDVSDYKQYMKSLNKITLADKVKNKLKQKVIGMLPRYLVD